MTHPANDFGNAVCSNHLRDSESAGDTAIALFTLDESEGVAYLQVHREYSDGAAKDDTARGWVEVWQEGHRMMVNSSDDEIVVTTGTTDTYLWASVYNAAGLWSPPCLFFMHLETKPSLL
jgi:hypothetical protein